MDFNKLVENSVDDNLKKFLENPFKNVPDIDEAIEISRKYGLDLHPNYLFYWNELTSSELVVFLEFLKNNYFYEDSKLHFSLTDTKRIFEILGVEHKIIVSSLDNIKSEKEAKKIVLDDINTKILMINLGCDDINKWEKCLDKIIAHTKENLVKTSVEILNECSEIGIRDKGGSYIGARMGRPEKAKMRKQFNEETRSHGLFPVGEQGGRSKNIVEVIKNTGYVFEEFRVFRCEKCTKDTIYPICEVCSTKTKQLYFERYTGKEVTKPDEKSIYYKRMRVNISTYDKSLRNILGINTEYPKQVKGISSTINKYHTTEHICKSFLRALNKVYVNKDGTVRYDMIEMGLTHFKPMEIGTSIEKLKELGYTHDQDGEPLENETQIVEIFPQDVVLPDCYDSGDELASDYVVNTGKYVDDLLEKFYGLERFYNFETKEDTIGHLIIGLAPHTSAGIVGRIIGYSKTQGCFSHPVWHAAQRRNLDGDENGIMLLLDGLINFSREYLPDRRGSRSVTADTIIFIEEDGEFKTVNIGDFIDEKFKYGYEFGEDGFEIQNTNNLKAVSFDTKTGKVSLENITKLIRHINDKKIYEIKTSDGWIKTTEDHSIFSLNFKTGEILEKKAGELKKGDFIVSLGKLDLKKDDAEILDVGKLNIKFDIRGEQIPKQIKLNEHFFRLLGFIYAEGHINKYKIEIGNTNKNIMDNISSDIENVLNYKPKLNVDKREEKYTNKIYYRINLPSQFGKVLLELGIKPDKAVKKNIPDFVFKTNKENILAFIDGYYLGDGTSYMNDYQRNMLRLYTSSEKFAAGLSLLAYLAGKKSTCRKSRDKRYDNKLKYEICISEYKLRNSFWSIYHLRKEINDGLKKSGLNKFERLSLLANINMNKRLKSSSREKIGKILLALQKSKDNSMIIEKVMSVLNQDIRLELVNEVREIEYKGYVYDLEVPKFQNFLCGPHPIFAHNTMDVSLVLTSHLYLDQIDDEVHGMDIVPFYPLEFYRANKEYVSPKSIKIEKVEKRIEVEDIDGRYLNYKFTHDTNNMNDTVLCSSYKSVPSMTEKLDLQLNLGRKLRAVDEHKVGTFVIDKHFMKDIKGNLRKFSMQTFRCTKCNTKYRRPPLIGKCTKCGESSINFTISEGSVKKYIIPSFKIINEYNVDPYIVETLELANLRVEGVFGKEEEKQKNLSAFFGK